MTLLSDLRARGRAVLAKQEELHSLAFENKMWNLRGMIPRMSNLDQCRAMDQWNRWRDGIEVAPDVVELLLERYGFYVHAHTI